MTKKTITADTLQRQLDIEAALEKVRIRSMAMQSPEELSDVLSVLFQQFDRLKINPLTVWLTLWNPENNTFTYRSTGTSGKRIQGQQEVDIAGMETWKALYDKWKSGASEDVEVLFYGNEDLGQLFTLMAETFESMPKGERLTAAHFPEGGYSVQGHCKFGYIGYTHTKEPTPEERNILKRFSTEFGRVYQRFLDLKKAEAQAREAQIEAALERVRARTMAMHKSQELGEVAAVLFEQINSLGATLERLNIGVIREDEEIIEWWSTEQGGRQINQFFKGSIHEPTTISKVYAAWKKGIDRLVIDQTGHELQEWISYVTDVIGLPFDPELIKGRRVHSVALFKHGGLLASTPEPLPESSMVLLERFSAVFEQTYTRFLDLQRAEAQAREAKIEAALERVRSKTMAMHNSQDVSETVATLFEEVKKLGLDESIRCGIGILEGYEGMETWSANAYEDGDIALRMGMLNMDIHPMLKGLKKAWEKGESGYQYDYDREDVKRYYKALNKEPEYPFNADLKRLPEKQFHKSFFFAEGILFSFTENPLSEEASNILRRFTNVFGQTYRRYLDLLKAEAQARESQIEAALERVRAKTMAMHNTEDIADMVTTFFNELLGLGIGNSARCGIGILNPSQVMQLWTASLKDEGDITLHSGPLDMRSHSLLQGLQKAWSQGESLFEYTLEGPEKLSYFKVINDAPEYPVKVALDKLPDSVWHNSFLFPNGTLFVFSESPIEEEIRDIFTRFASVFGQTYIRFLDLERAEKQARESRIEAALERVRAKAMAMHSSEDLRQTITVIFEELKKLEIQSLRLGLGLLDAKDPIGKIVTSRIDDKGEIIEVSGKFRLEGHPVLKEIYSHFRSQEDYFPVLEGDEIKSYYQGLQKSVDVEGLGTSSKHYGCFLYFPEGCLYAWAATPHSEEQISILRKFSRVVEITYRRYNDLVEAETREKEAVKQASLDRVRGEIASMRTTRDLERITPLVWKELTTLGIPFFRCGVFIMDEVNQMVNVYLTTPEGEALGAMDLPFDFDMSLIQKGVDHWRRQKILVEKWNQEQFVEMTQKLLAQGQVKNVKSYQAGETPPERLVLQQVPFAQGMLYVGSTEPLSGEEMDIVKALTRTFAIAYARYEDFSELEKAKKKIENTLTDLKATQAQLIQSEKMASLGELTAGIAHEIKNPLNFVNNFSEVSRELLVELMEEMENGDLEEVRALAGDIIQNLDKIVHHGQRADSIVKGMLQHSRSGDGKKEPTDLNELADEYLRLAYHGLRAKDKSFNARMETDFDDSLGNVDVVPQEIGRVLLNLLTNAFHAVKERKASEPEGYDPTVWVQTQKTISGFKISVRDNGKGIPDKIVDKIFQPFFTTKPTGEGTGLGLSLSYDIVKAHGGELKVETTQGEGTTFSMIFKTETT